MDKQASATLLAGVVILLLAACGQIENEPFPEPGVVPSSVGSAPTAVLTNGPGSERFDNYIGSTHPPLADGLSEDFGMLIQDAEDHSLKMVSDGENKMLWLAKLTGYDSNGNAYWEVKDVLDLSNLSNLEAGLILVPDGCTFQGVPDHEILVTSKDGIIRQAWRANTSLDRFEVIPASGIECHSDKAMNIS